MATVAIATPKSSTWWLFLLQGTAGIVLGVMLLTAPAVSLVGLVSFLGFYWVITGVLALVRVFADRSVHWIWSLITGVIGILAGVFVLNHPLLAALTVPTILVFVLGLEGLALGVFEIATAFTGGGIGSFLLGLINLAIGGLLLAAPVAATLAVPLVFGVLLLVQGVGLIVWAFRVRA